MKNQAAVKAEEKGARDSNLLKMEPLI